MKTNSGYRVFLRLIALIIVPAAIACSAGGDSDDADSPSHCTKDADCGDNGVCVYNRCLGGDDGSGGTNGDDQAGASGDTDSDDASRNGSTPGTVSPGIAAAASVTTAFSDEICAEGSAIATRLHPQVILLLDGSSSMRENYGDTTKWAAMRQALVDPNNGVVKTMESLIEFALVIYAGEYLNGGGECPVPGDVVPHAINNYNAIEAALPAESPGRRTPTGEALDAVCRALPGINDEGSRPQYVILATDGEPNSCEGGGGRQGSPAYQSVIDAANRCCENGVTLYVVSLASATPEFQAHLQQLADIGVCHQGGSAPVYSPQSPQQLSDDLGHLIGGALNCDVLINGTIVEGKECEGSEVRLGDQVLKCNDSNGWILAEPNLIRLQGQACEDFKNNPTKEVTAKFPCEVLIPDDPGDDEGTGGSGGSTGSQEPGTVIII